MPKRAENSTSDLFLNYFFQAPANLMVAYSIMRVSGSKDGWLRVWSIAHGTPITMFNMHYQIQEVFITDKASRVVVQLTNQCLVPLMCLHNSPAGEVKSQSQISIQLPGGEQ